MEADGLKIEIFKEPVLYFVSLQCKILDSNETFIHTVPVIAGFSDDIDDVGDGIDGDTEHVGRGDVVLGTIPAPVGTFRVSAWINDSGPATVLGFEYPGIPRDWTKIAASEAELCRKLST